MPNRILREGILTSERIALLNWAEETFYRRLMSVVDDFGRYYANPMLLRAACYPLQLDRVSDADIGKWLLATEKAALVSVYPALDGKRYLQLLDFRQQVRAKESKFPQPPGDDARMHSTCVADAKQVQANAHLGVVVCGDGDGDEDVIGGARAKPKRSSALPPDFQPDEAGVQLASELGIDIKLELVKFTDHHLARGTSMKDWQAAWRTWARKAREFQAPRAGPRKSGNEPAWRADARRRMQQAVPGIAERSPSDPVTIDVEARHATPKALG